MPENAWRKGRSRKQRARFELEGLEIRQLLSVNPSVVSINRSAPAGPATGASAVSYTVTFSTAVTGVDPMDFKAVTTGNLAANGSLAVSGSGAVYTVGVSGIHGNGTLQLQLVDDDSIRDGALDPLGGLGAGNGSFQGQVYDVIQAGPQLLSIARSSPSGNGVSSVKYAVTFSEPVTGVSSGAFHIVTGGSVAASPAVAVSGGPTVYTVTVNGISGLGTLGLTFTDNGSVRDAAGNPLAQTQTATFNAQPTVIAGTKPFTLALADVNGDGKADLIVTDESDNTVGVMLGNGDGTFQARQTFATGASPLGVAVADLNGDGKPDLAISDYGAGTVTVLWGNGNGTFQAGETLAVGAGPGPIVVSDLNGDGKPDLIVGNFTSGSVSVLMGSGGGGFGPQQTFAVGDDPVSFALADLNNDGKADLIVANYTDDTFSILPGNGDGTFGARQSFATPAWATSVASADLNHDGNADLIIANSYQNSVSVLLGNGNGTFQKAHTFATGLWAGDVEIGDINGDGIADLAVANFSGGSVTVLAGNGDGTFGAGETFAAGLTPQAVALGDVNGDGRTDLAVTDAAGSGVTVLTGAFGPITSPVYSIGPLPAADTITGTPGADQIVLTLDPDGTHVDWTMGTSAGEILRNDADGLTINGNGSTDVITLSAINGNPLLAVLHLNGEFLVNGLTGANPLAGTTLDVGQSTVYINYVNEPSPAALIQQYLTDGYNAGGWNGVATPSTGAITSAAAASGPANVFGVGFADSADGIVAGQPANTVEIRYTVMGDANLDRVVDLNDAKLLQANWNTINSPAWDRGNFNYDSAVNLNDAMLMTRNWGGVATGSTVVAGVAPAPSSTAAITPTFSVQPTVSSPPSTLPGPVDSTPPASIADADPAAKSKHGRKRSHNSKSKT